MKLISGGQSGADRAALDVALERGIAYGGWCPKGGWAEDFPVPPGLLTKYPNLKETPLADPAQRTEWNVRDADVCLVITGAGGLEVSKGTTLACQQAQRYGKPCFVADLREPDMYEQTALWLRAQLDTLGPDLKLAIGGPRESEAPGIYARAKAFIDMFTVGRISVSMATIDSPSAMADWMWEARLRRMPYRNLPDKLRPQSIAEAYAAQEAYYRLAKPVYGEVGGAKIATTTKVMQQLMGIGHPCGGAIFARTIHTSPARLRIADFVNLRIESEIALKLGADLPARSAPWTREAVAATVAGAMPAFELIEDRHADYAQTDALSLIVENCWNGGAVVGPPKSVSAAALVGIAGRLTVGGKPMGEGRAEDPCATLAWLANHLAERGRDLKAGMVIITGSLIPTVSIASGERAVFSAEGLGDVVMDAV